MKSRVLILAVLLMLALSACDSGELERLRTENEELQTQKNKQIPHGFSYVDSRL